MNYTVLKTPLSLRDNHTRSRVGRALQTIAGAVALFIAGTFSPATAFGASATDTTLVVLPIEFPISSYTVDPSYSCNAASLDSLDALAADSTLSLGSVRVDGNASPDGSFKSNVRLARRRMLALADYLRGSCVLPPDVDVVPGEYGVCWSGFRTLVAQSGMPGTEDIIALCSEGSDASPANTAARIRALRAHNGGATWKKLASDIFPKLRNAVSVAVLVAPRPADVLPAPLPTPADTVAESVPEPVQEPAVLPSEPVRAISDDVCARGWHAETNALEWSLAIANIAGEFDFARRWSAVLSLHYSAWDYGKSTRKFRTFIFRPEVRFWLLNDCHNGLFLDLHAQMAAYNFALPKWEYRIQDVDGTHPALGGGIGLGYRLPLGNKGRWALQAQIGAGVYRLDYNRFENRPDGALVDRRTRTFFGIDNAALSVVFNFNGQKR